MPPKRVRKPRAKPAILKPATPPPTPLPPPPVLTNLEQTYEASNWLYSASSIRQVAQSQVIQAEVELAMHRRVIERDTEAQSDLAAIREKVIADEEYLKEAQSRLQAAKGEENAAIKRVSNLYAALSGREKEEYDKTKGQGRRLEKRNAGLQAQVAKDQHRQSQRNQVEEWYQLTEIAFENYSQIKVFPTPPALYHCNKDQCRRSVHAAKFALGMCSCDLKEVFRVYSTYHQDFDPNEERKRWHPDLFSGCQDKRMREMAEEIFKVLGEMKPKLHEVGCSLCDNLEGFCNKYRAKLQLLKEGDLAISDR
ncbi:uncharacterized protein MYCFIDRAFT_83137 [Pseudocercospora fijiensis CIRAD86]|uniref:Uncharacterized protein n=1 Tax=Pseudocercospora fijiensis (strain CIRAD86) TaxID=383855 RepID=M3AKL8_PSEFD|nr:uncharacterized protein MYCFIDRAFT_83137 [Pseudocercospora fijiensis CIRAD86]EME85126.1 hypothetical protein MYCFIDRAFT_83137 [Pseudocercospora fijiensis CIRAD86]